MTKVDKPEFLLAAEEEAKRRGTTWQQVLADDLEAARAAGYPGPECLLPAEIERYFADGFLADVRMEHTADCTACSSLLESAAPEPAEIQRILAEVRARRRSPATTGGRGQTRGSTSEHRTARWSALLGVIVVLFGYVARRLWRLLGRQPRPAPEAEPESVPERSLGRV
ncbi:MAG TPA: hypothetical protein VKM72_09350 [Thermoanaerobaculia bacterium]|nr:hypothetical protein [Thermoanaerobaculia bacterium]